MPGVLFVCTGNICRSPTAEVVLRTMLVDRGLTDITVDSAGTHDYHLGEAPDMRAQIAAQARGYDLSTLRARQLTAGDFEHFDPIIIMDGENKLYLERHFKDQDLSKVRRLLAYAPMLGNDIPDPYYASGGGFERVLEMIEIAATKLVETLEAERRSAFKDLTE
jgi:protein-tyrosine phosphatase